MNKQIILIVFAAFFLAACGGGGGASEEPIKDGTGDGSSGDGRSDNGGSVDCTDPANKDNKECPKPPEPLSAEEITKRTNEAAAKGDLFYKDHLNKPVFWLDSSEITTEAELNAKVEFAIRKENEPNFLFSKKADGSDKDAFKAYIKSASKDAEPDLDHEEVSKTYQGGKYVAIYYKQYEYRTYEIYYDNFLIADNTDHDFAYVKRDKDVYQSSESAYSFENTKGKYSGEAWARDGVGRIDGTFTLNIEDESNPNNSLVFDFATKEITAGYKGLSISNIDFANAVPSGSDGTSDERSTGVFRIRSSNITVSYTTNSSGNTECTDIYNKCLGGNSLIVFAGKSSKYVGGIVRYSSTTSGTGDKKTIFFAGEKESSTSQ